jgi:hypothetical protein
MSTKKTPQSGSNGLPPANAHAARRSARSPSDPDVILATLPVGTPDYLRVLGAILKKFNHRHSTKHKGVSFKTMLDRQRLYASFFRELRHHTPTATSIPDNWPTDTSKRWWNAGSRAACRPRPFTTT